MFWKASCIFRDTGGTRRGRRRLTCPREARPRGLCSTSALVCLRLVRTAAAHTPREEGVEAQVAPGGRFDSLSFEPSRRKDSCREGEEIISHQMPIERTLQPSEPTGACRYEYSQTV